MTDKSTTDKSTTMRQRKTPAQRAEEALSTSTRKVDALTKKRDRLIDDLEQVEAERAAEVVRRDYLASNPDLPAKPVAKPVSS